MDAFMIEPSVKELQRRLAAFEAAHRECDYLDQWANVLKCREYNQHYIDRLRKKIATYQRQGWRGRLWIAGGTDTD